MFDIAWLNSDKAKIEKKAKELGFENVFFVDEAGKADYILIKAQTKEELNNKIAKAKGRKIIVLGSNDEVNRTALENENVSILLSPEHTRQHDYMTYRNSGLNHVLCKIAHDNNIAIAVDFNELKRLKGKEKALKIGRIMQNIRLCRKYKVKIMILSLAKSPREMASIFDLKVLARTLGISKLE